MAWIPDLQEKKLPSFFSSKELRFRNNIIKGLIDSNLPIVFSSNNSRTDFFKYYPYATNQTFIFHFAAQIPIVPEDVDIILKKYGVEKNTFFLCANQFWVHKNHRLLFEAVKLLRDRGENITVLCSGNNRDYRNPKYYQSLSDFVSANQLHNNIRLLGMINRKDLVALMVSCRAVIQPSLFEGWNTSIEEAKALDKYMILSNLALHKEQVRNNASFFSSNDVKDLADKISEISQACPQIKPNHYSRTVYETARSFMDIVSTLQA